MNYETQQMLRGNEPDMRGPRARSTTIPPQQLADYSWEPEGLIGGHNVTVLRNGEEFYPRILAAIAEAKSYVHLETYILVADETGRRITDALCEKSRAGVPVRLIYDGLGSFDLTPDFTQELEHAGIALLEFGPITRRFSFVRWMKRDHRKILVVDGKVGFVGGINISNDYAPKSQGGAGWRDTHAELVGPQVAALGKLFLETWTRYGGAPVQLPGEEPYQFASVALRKRVENRLAARKKWKRKKLPGQVVADEAASQIQGRLGKVLRATGDRFRSRMNRNKATQAEDRAGATSPKQVAFSPETVNSNRGTEYVKVLGSDYYQRRTGIRRHILHALRQAKRQVILHCAYFVPDRGIIKEMLEAARRGVDVQLIVPSVSDVKAVQWAGEYTYAELLRAGVHILLWGPTHMHAKTMTVDGVWSMIGSYNLDYVSLNFNMEVVMEVVGEPTAQALQKMWRDDIGSCEPLALESWQKRSWLAKFRSWLSYRFRRLL